MKALIDTNPLVSALLKPDGPSGQIFQRWRAGEFELAVSPSTLAELRDVLQRPHITNKYRLSAPDIEHHLILDVVPADPQDNHVLAAAVETNCRWIISGDRHLLKVGEYQGVGILTPRDFLTLLESSESG